MGGSLERLNKGGGGLGGGVKVFDTARVGCDIYCAEIAARKIVVRVGWEQNKDG